LFIPDPKFPIPDPNFFHPGSTSALGNLIRVVHPGSESWFFTHPGSRIQGSKRHRIPDPDPQHCYVVKETAVVLRAVPSPGSTWASPASLSGSCSPSTITLGKKNSAQSRHYLINTVLPVPDLIVNRIVALPHGFYDLCSSAQWVPPTIPAAVH